ncbi:hypothetical protein, partial [Geomonas sp.]|uniref:hypothetical protein n=1 Tax=Geomonas sp. TaxID=2651584 RepID=UPI002B49C9DC
HFDKLWNNRNEHDALFGYRGGRQQGLGRKIITGICRATVHALFGKGITDVNTPYRLVRSSILSPIISRIPADTFAPNVLISGVLVGEGARIYNQCVPHEGRRTGAVSIVRWKLWKAALKSFMQSIRFKLSKP